MTTLTLAPAPAIPAVTARIARRPRIPALQVTALPRGAHVLGALAVTTLVAGVLISIVTTSDPLWWQLYFSQLGTFGDFSARMFNGSVLVSGALFAAYGVALGTQLPAGVGPRTRRALRVSLVSIGANMVAIGLIPIPVSRVLHDLAAMGLALSLLALLCSGFGMRRKTHAVRVFLVVGAVILVIGMVVLTLDLITLALYEAVAFSTLGVWLRLLPGLVALQPAPVAAPVAAAGIRPAMEEWPTPAPAPSRPNAGSTRIAPSRRPVGCTPARSGRGDSTRVARSLARSAWSVAPASRNGSAHRSLTTADRGTRRETPRQDLFGGDPRSAAAREAGADF